MVAGKFVSPIVFTLVDEPHQFFDQKMFFWYYIVPSIVKLTIESLWSPKFRSLFTAM